MPPPPAKKRRTDRNQLAEITFDPSARNEYLTGFHKRKQQRIKTAQELAAKTEREDRVKERRQLREQRKEDLEQHLAAFDTELRRQNPDLGSTDAGGKRPENDDEWAGIDEQAAEPVEEVEREDEYVDEDKYTTVTVEAMGEESEEPDEARPAASKDGAEAANTSKKRPWNKNALDGKTKPKKKKFRYESKAERQATRQKQNKSSKAARARREKKP